MKPSNEIIDFIKTHSKNETYLYNNRLTYLSSGRLTGLITEEQYIANHSFIKNFNNNLVI